MADRPIIFSAPMVRALLAGRKTQTRRLATSPLARCQLGDRLWVRESARATELDDGRDGVGYEADMVWHPIENTAEAAERWLAMHWYGRDGSDNLRPAGKLVPSIHMPRWASRLTLIVEAVRVEPLQAISEADALAEGVDRLQFPERGDWGWPQLKYRDLWNSLHTTPGERWDDDPDIIALTFRVERANIDQLRREAA